MARSARKSLRPGERKSSPLDERERRSSSADTRACRSTTTRTARPAARDRGTQRAGRDAMVWRRDAPLALLAAEADGPRCCGDFNPPTLPRGGGRSPLPHRDHVRGRSTCRSARTANLALSCARTLGWAWAAANLRGSAPRFARIVPIRPPRAGGSTACSAAQRGARAATRESYFCPVGLQSATLLRPTH